MRKNESGGTMAAISRRKFSSIALALSASARKVMASQSLDETLRSGIAQRKIPAAAGMVATPYQITWSGAFGTRDSESQLPVKEDSIFSIASMTKAITTTAALQLVERGVLSLDEPVSKHLSALDKPAVLKGFDPDGKPILRPAKKPLTLKHLLTHTSGFAYDIWDERMSKYKELQPPPDNGHKLAPLVFEPGAHWQYGTSLDWTGRLVEAVTDLTLEEYFQRNILRPLGMADTSYILPAAKFDRLVSSWHRQPDGSLKQTARTPPAEPAEFSGGGGLFSTAGDYVRFMQMILQRGRGQEGQEILRPATVDMMTSNQIGHLSAGKLKSTRPDVSSDVDFHPGFVDKWGFGFLINTTAYDGGRSAGSLAWAGIENTFYWIDPRRQLCAAVLMQFYPFCDREAVGLLRDFERAVYAA